LEEKKTKNLYSDLPPANQHLMARLSSQVFSWLEERGGV